MTTTPALITEAQSSILAQPLYGHLGTIRPDNTVQVNPMWFDFDGENLRFTHTRSRAKFRNLQHNPTMSLEIIDPENNFNYTEVRGELVEVLADTEGEFYVHLGRRYGNPGQQAPADKAERVILVMRITKVISG